MQNAIEALRGLFNRREKVTPKPLRVDSFAGFIASLEDARTIHITASFITTSKPVLAETLQGPVEMRGETHGIRYDSKTEDDTPVSLEEYYVPLSADDNDPELYNLQKQHRAHMQTLLTAHKKLIQIHTIFPHATSTIQRYGETVSKEELNEAIEYARRNNMQPVIRKITVIGD